MPNTGVPAKICLPKLEISLSRAKYSQAWPLREVAWYPPVAVSLAF